MDIRQRILQFTRKNKFVKSADLAKSFGFSRQYASKLLQILVNSGEILKLGFTRSAQYTLPQFLNEINTFKSSKRFLRSKIIEHEVVESFLALAAHGFPPGKRKYPEYFTLCFF